MTRVMRRGWLIRSTRWPGEWSLAEEMDVELRYTFAAVAAVVDHDSVAGFGDAEFSRERSGDSVCARLSRERSFSFSRL